MSSLGTGNPFTQDFRLLRGIPATLNGSAGAGAVAITANNALVAASVRDPWIQAVNTGSPAISIPAFVRAAAVVSFDFYLCSGNGSPVPNDIVEITVPNDAAAATVSTIVGGTVLLNDETTTNVFVADNQIGRVILLQADPDGRVRGTYTLAGNDNRIAVVRHRGITVAVTPTVAPTP